MRVPAIFVGLPKTAIAAADMLEVVATGLDPDAFWRGDAAEMADARLAAKEVVEHLAYWLECKGMSIAKVDAQAAETARLRAALREIAALDRSGVSSSMTEMDYGRAEAYENAADIARRHLEPKP